MVQGKVLKYYIRLSVVRNVVKRNMIKTNAMGNAFPTKLCLKDVIFPSGY